MSTDKTEAKRLADALERITYFNGKCEERDAAVQMLRRWPDAGEPVGHLHSNGDFCQDRALDGGVMWPVPLYTAPPADRIAAQPDGERVIRDGTLLQAERIAALEAELRVSEGFHKVAVQQRDAAWREIAALEAVIEQARVALGVCKGWVDIYGQPESQQQVNAALRAITLAIGR